jgi:hypothetical protein
MYAKSVLIVFLKAPLIRHVKTKPLINYCDDKDIVKQAKKEYNLFHESLYQGIYQKN